MRLRIYRIKLSHSPRRVSPRAVAHVSLCRFAIPFACYEARHFESAAVRWPCPDSELDRAASGHSSIRSGFVDRSCVLVCGAGTNGSLCKREFRSSRSRRSTRFRWLLFCHDYALPFRAARDRSCLAARINARRYIGILAP